MPLFANCRNCGAKLAPDAQWCSLCYAKVEPVAATPDMIPTSRSALDQLQPPSTPLVDPATQQLSPPATSMPAPASAPSSAPPAGPAWFPDVPSHDLMDPVPAPLSDGTPNSADPDEWVALLAAQEGMDRDSSGMLAKRSTRTLIGIVGALLVIMVAAIIFFVIAKVSGSG